MKKCPFCAEEIQDEAIVCRYCGRELEQELPPEERKKCPYCAEWIRSEAKVCRYCGSDVGLRENIESDSHAQTQSAVNETDLIISQYKSLFENIEKSDAKVRNSYPFRERRPEVIGKLIQKIEMTMLDGLKIGWVEIHWNLAYMTKEDDPGYYKTLLEESVFLGYKPYDSDYPTWDEYITALARVIFRGLKSGIFQASSITSFYGGIKKRQKFQLNVSGLLGGPIGYVHMKKLMKKLPKEGSAEMVFLKLAYAELEARALEGYG